MTPEDPNSLPPTVLRKTTVRGGPNEKESGGRPPPSAGFDLALDPRYYGLFAPPIKPGDLGSLARYRVLALLGEGGMGMVFRAEDVDLGRQVALKVMRPEYAAERPLQQRFLREARHTANLQHENIVTVYQVGEDKGTLYMALELLQGGTLEQRLGLGPLALEEALRIAREMACGLAAAHARGLIHRDVKPDNVWIEAPSGRAKLLDFGLARPDRESQVLTHAGTVIGTPGYMSPEQSRAETLDERADIFSLGCVLYRMVSGHGPFPCRSFEDMCRAFKEAPPALVGELNEDAPVELEYLVAQMLEIDRTKRPESAQEVALRIAEIERSLGVDVHLRPSMFPVPQAGAKALPASAGAPGSRPRVGKSAAARAAAARRYLWLKAAGGIGAFVATLLFVMWLFRPGPGALKIISSDPNVVVGVRHHDGPLWEAEPGAERTYRARPGPYVFEVVKGPNLRVYPSEFHLRSGYVQTVFVLRAGEAAPEVPAQEFVGEAAHDIVSELPRGAIR